MCGYKYNLSYERWDRKKKKKIFSIFPLSFSLPLKQTTFLSTSLEKKIKNLRNGGKKKK